MNKGFRLLLEYNYFIVNNDVKYVKIKINANAKA